MTDEIKEREKRPCPYDAAQKAEMTEALDAHGVINDLASMCAEYASDCPRSRYLSWSALMHPAFPYMFASNCDCTATERGRMFTIAQVNGKGQIERRAVMHTRNPGHCLYLRGDPGVPQQLRRPSRPWCGIIKGDYPAYYFHGNSKVRDEIRTLVAEDSPVKTE